MTVLALHVVAPAEPDVDCPRVIMPTGYFTAAEVQPLDYLHDPVFPGRVLYVDERASGLGIVVRTRSAVGTWATVTVWRAPTDPVELSRLVDEHLTRDAEGL